jgi:nitrate reductase delta subunit
MDRMEAADALAAMFEYPGEDYRARLARCRRTLADADAGLAELLDRFEKAIAGLSTEAQQELFTQSFDLSPACVLDLGWHLFGEQYERGEFLVKLRGLLRDAGLRESAELPDHLTHVLRLLGRMEPEGAEEFAAACVFPALKKARGGFGETPNAFALLLDAALRWLESQYPRTEETAAAAPGLPVWNGRSFQ